MASWTIRDGTDEDIEPVLRLWGTAGGPSGVSATREAVAGLLATNPQALILAESEGLVVGSLIAAWDGWRGCFYRLAVHPDMRRLGLAAAILREGERRLLAQGAVRLTAIVSDEDQAAMGFWEAAGYLRQQHRARFVRPAGR